MIDIVATTGNSTTDSEPADGGEGFPPFENDTIPAAPGAFDAALDDGVGASGMPVRIKAHA